MSSAFKSFDGNEHSNQRNILTSSLWTKIYIFYVCIESILNLDLLLFMWRFCLYVLGKIPWSLEIWKSINNYDTYVLDIIIYYNMLRLIIADRILGVFCALLMSFSCNLGMSAPWTCPTDQVVPNPYLGWSLTSSSQKVLISKNSRLTNVAYNFMLQNQTGSSHYTFLDTILALEKKTSLKMFR